MSSVFQKLGMSCIECVKFGFRVSFFEKRFSGFAFFPAKVLSSIHRRCNGRVLGPGETVLSVAGTRDILNPKGTICSEASNLICAIFCTIFSWLPGIVGLAEEDLLWFHGNHLFCCSLHTQS